MLQPNVRLAQLGAKCARRSIAYNRPVLRSFLKSLKPAASDARGAPLPAAPSPQLRYARGGTIVGFISGSMGDALKEGLLEMLEPLRPHCSRVALVDVREAHWERELEAALADPVWFALGNFGAGELHEVEDGRYTSRWAPAGIPFVRLYGDTPAYFPERHTQHFANSINVYFYVEHFDFFVRWFGPKGLSVLLPFHPVDAVPPESVDIEARAASGVIVFPKNGNAPDTLREYWRAALPPGVADALESIAEEVNAALDDDADLAGRVHRYYAARGIDLSEDRRLLFFLVAQLDDYARRVKSTMIARSLLDLPVIVRGVNWEHVDFTGRRARRDPRNDYTSTRELLDRSVAMLDMAPNTLHGPHDRVLRAAGRYAAFLTNRTPFFTNSFQDAQAFTFRFNPDSIRECVEGALARPRETVERGIAHGKRMRELLSRDRYVEQMLAVVDACALACGPRPEGTQPYVAFQPRA